LTGSVLKLRDVRKIFSSEPDNVTVLNGLDFDIQQGEFVMITGPSGSGKSTFLHIAALLDRADHGLLEYNGQNLEDLNEVELAKLRAKHIGTVFQRYALLSNRSAIDNVRFRFRYLNGSERPADKQAELALKRVGLDHVAQRPVRVLSGGESQRVAIARAIANQPSLLIADEPTGNLDARSTEVIMDIFRDLNADGLGVMMVTHNLELLPYSSRHLVLRDGRLMEHTAQR
jgi:putative ABC transport system ATP-binding protein